MAETASRLLALLALLQARRGWTGAELAERLEVTPRTLRRDVERLRRLGYPVRSRPGPAGGYELRAGTAMPPLLLDDDEAIAIALGLRTAAHASVTGIEEAALRALVKLEGVLPAHLRRRVQTLGAATLTLAPLGPSVDPQALAVIATACRDGERIRFTYRGREGAESRRDVEPHSLVNSGRRWYLLAWDRGREDWRTFRLDRLERATPAGMRAAPREPPGGDAAAFVSRSLRAAWSRYSAHVTLHASADRVRARAPWAGEGLTPLPDGRCEYRTADDDLDWLAVRIAALDVELEVHGPPELIEHLHRLAGRLARALPAPPRGQWEGSGSSPS